MVHCTVCHIDYCDDNGKDREHAIFHKKYLKAVEFLKYEPDCYVVREEKKSNGWRLFNDGKSDQEHFNGAMIVLRSHFDRSLMSVMAEKYYKQHPDFKNYCSMASIEYLFEKRPKIILRLRNLFGTSKNSFPEGKSYWYPTIKRKIISINPKQGVKQAQG